MLTFLVFAFFFLLLSGAGEEAEEFSTAFFFCCTFCLINIYKNSKSFIPADSAVVPFFSPLTRSPLRKISFWVYGEQFADFECDACQKFFISDTTNCRLARFAGLNIIYSIYLQFIPVHSFIHLSYFRSRQRVQLFLTNLNLASKAIKLCLSIWGCVLYGLSCVNILNICFFPFFFLNIYFFIRKPFLQQNNLKSS